MIITTLSLSIFFDKNEAYAAITDKCDGTSTQNNLTINNHHGKIFYIDSGQNQNVDAAYVSYQISASSAKTNLWAKIDNFTGGVVKLANPLDDIQPVGNISSGSSKTVFFLLKATSSSSLAQSHVVRIYSSNPETAGATEVYSCTYTFNKVAETIKAAANKVTSISSTSVSRIGSTMTITVQGNTGTIGSGNSTDGRIIWVSPVARSNWPSQALRLVGTEIKLYDNPSRNTNSLISTTTDKLKITFDVSQSGNKYYYTSVYTFLILQPASSSVSIAPIAQISSGTQMKHTDLGNLPNSGTTLDTSGATVSLAVTKSVATTASYSAGETTFDYTVTLNNTGASSVDVDYVTDTKDSNLSYVSGSAKFNSSSITDPSVLSSDSNKLVFSGPFTVPNATSRTITYKMKRTGCTSGSYSYTNSAVATIGSLTIGSAATTYSETVASGTCGSTTVTNTTTNKTIAVEVTTVPATSISASGATLNGTVDPNGVSGKTIYFQWGTNSSLSTFTTETLATATTTGTYPYSVSKSLTGLTSGTTYYFRILVDGVYGEILSFNTLEIASTPTATTTTVTGISVSGSNASATFNGQIDPNLVTNGAKAKFKYATDSSSGSCSSLGTVTTTGFVQSETDTSTEDAILTGSFATDVDISVTGLSKETYYCFAVIAFYNSSTADWSSSLSGSWVSFYSTVKSNQTITFNTPASTAVGQTVSAGATTTSSLTITYTSNSTDICTVSGSTITIVGAGICSITANQEGNGSYYAAEPVTVNFTTTAILPTATTNDATSIGSTTALLNGSVTAGGESSTTRFCYGTDSGLSGCTFVNASQSPVSGNSSTAVSYSLSGLASSTTYYFRVTITNSAGTATGVIKNFTTGATASAPTATTNSATNVTSSTAQLNGSITAGNDATTVTFCYGTDSGLSGCTTVTADESPVYGNSSTSVLRSITGLNPNTTYYFRVIASNSNTANVQGSILNFTTAVAAPTATTVAASSVSATSATLNGTIIAGGASTTTTFCYATNIALTSCTSVTAAESPVTGNSSTNVTYNLTSLSPNTTYYFQVRATNSNSSVNGEVLNFSTSKDNQTINFTLNSYSNVTYGNSSPSVTNNSASSGLSVTLTSSTPTICTISGTTITILSVGLCTIEASQDGNDSYNAAPSVNRSFTIDPKTLTVTSGKITANNKSYNANTGATITIASDPLTGIVGSDVVTLLSSGTTSTFNNATVGTGKPVTVSGSFTLGGLNASNYSLTQPSLSLTANITVVTISVTASSHTLTVGSPIPTIIATYAGFQGSDDENVISNLVCSTTYLTTSPAGTYVTSCSGGTATNYDFSYVNGTVTANSPSSSGGGGGTPTSSPTPTPTPTPSPTSTRRSSPNPPVIRRTPIISTPTPQPSNTTILQSPFPQPTSSLNALPLNPNTGILAINPQNPNSPINLATEKPLGTVENGAGKIIVAPENLLPEIESFKNFIQQFNNSAASANSSLNSTSQGVRRTTSELAREKIVGFNPNEGVTVEVIGARATAQFIVSPATISDPIAIAAAIKESTARTATDFAKVENAIPTSAPISNTPLIAPRPTIDMVQRFKESNLLNPITVDQLQIPVDSKWLSISASAQTYKPGTTIYLVVTTQPIIFGEAKVDKYGRAQITGKLPINALKSGAHTVRVVGIRELSGVSVDKSGDIVLADETMQEIQRFDKGTQATIKMSGKNISGGNHYAFREVPLVLIMPWWTIWIVGWTLFLAVVAKFFRKIQNKKEKVFSTIVMIASTLPALWLGWIRFSYPVMGVGALISLIGVLCIWFLPAWGSFRKTKKEMVQKFRSSEGFWAKFSPGK